MIGRDIEPRSCDSRDTSFTIRFELKGMHEYLEKGAFNAHSGLGARLCGALGHLFFRTGSPPCNKALRCLRVPV